MSRRRSRSRFSPSTAVLALVVILLGSAIVSSGGWTPVLIAVVFALVLASLTSKRGHRRSRH